MAEPGGSGPIGPYPPGTETDEQRDEYDRPDEIVLHQQRHHAQHHALHRHRPDERRHAAAAERHQVQAHRQADQEIESAVHG